MVDLAKRYAARITKQWVMAVRRGWLSLLNPTINDFGDAVSAARKLEAFGENLKEQVFFVVRGPNTGAVFGKDRDKIIKEFEVLHKNLYEFRSSVEHWARAYAGEYDRMDPTGRENGAKMLEVYKKDFKGSLVGWQKGNRSKSNPYGNERKIEADKLLDRVLKILYEDVASRDEVSETNKKYDIPDEIYTDREVYKQFDIHGMKVIVQDITLSPGEVEEYIKFLDEAYQRMRAKGLGAMWYGSVFIDCKSCGGENPYGKDLGVGGHFNIGKNHVKIFSRPSAFIVELMAHELGHRYWFKHLNEAQRQRFKDWFLDGSVPAVSKYGETNADEAFAEVVRWVTVGKDITRDQLESMKAILNDKGSRLARRYVESLTASGIYDDNMDHDFQAWDPVAPWKTQWNDFTVEIVALKNKIVKTFFNPILKDPKISEDVKAGLKGIASGSGQYRSVYDLLRGTPIPYTREDPLVGYWKGQKAEVKKTIAWLKGRKGKTPDPARFLRDTRFALDALMVADYGWENAVGVGSSTEIEAVRKAFDTARNNLRGARNSWRGWLSNLGGWHPETDPVAYARILEEALQETEVQIESVLKVTNEVHRHLIGTYPLLFKSAEAEHKALNAITDKYSTLYQEFALFLVRKREETKDYNLSVAIGKLLDSWSQADNEANKDIRGLWNSGATTAAGKMSSFFSMFEEDIKKVLATAPSDQF